MALNALETINELDNAGNQLGVINVPRGMDVYRPKTEGEVSLVIIPYVTSACPIKGVEPGDLFYCRDYWVYRGLGATKKERCIDNKKTFGERCAITESLADWGGDIKQKPRSSRLCLFNVWFPAENKVMLMDFSYANFAEVLFEAVRLQAKRNNGKKAWIGNFADPVEGSVISFSWKEDAFEGHKFFKASNFEFERHEGLEKDVLDKATDLDKCPIRLQFAEVAAMFLGDEHEEIEEDTAPPPAVINKPKTAEPAPAKAEEPEEEEPATKAVPKKVKAGLGGGKPIPGTGIGIWPKGAYCYYEGKKCVVKKADGDVITIAEVADDDERYKVSGDDLSPFGEPEEPKPAKAAKTKKPEPVAAVASGDAAFDEGWDD